MSTKSFKFFGCYNVISYYTYNFSLTIFSSFFSNSSVEFVRRQANAVAHVLAREVMFLASPTIYYDILECIESLIINEML